jgi:hypothetical protein
LKKKELNSEEYEIERTRPRNELFMKSVSGGETEGLRSVQVRQFHEFKMHVKFISQIIFDYIYYAE